MLKHARMVRIEAIQTQTEQEQEERKHIQQQPKRQTSTTHPSTHYTRSNFSLTTIILTIIAILISLPTSCLGQTLVAPFSSVLVSAPGEAFGIPPQADQKYTCKVVTDPTDHTAYVLSYGWFIGTAGSNPAVISSGFNPEFTIATSAGYKKGDQVQCGVIATEVSGGTTHPTTGYQVSTNVKVLTNIAPTVAQSRIAPITPRPGPGASAVAYQTTDTLNCVAAGADDVDDKSAGWPAFTGHFFNFTWIVNNKVASWSYVGVGMADLTTLPSPSSNLTVPVSRGDVVQCSVRPYDGQNWGTAADSAPISIGVTPPITTGVTINSEANGIGSPVQKDVNAKCNIASIASPDNDPSTSWSFLYSFISNGEYISNQTTPVLVSPTWIRGDQIKCEVVASVDVAGVIWSGDRIASQPEGQQVENTPTVTVDAVVLPSSPTVESNLTCAAGTTQDADGDAPVSYAFKWTKNGVDLVNVTNTTSQLPAFSGLKGDSFTCQVATYDGFAFGAYSPAISITLQKSRPVLSNTSLLFNDPTEPTSVTCVPGPSFDADGNTPDVYLYSWTLNGVLQTSGGAFTTNQLQAPTNFQLGPTNTLSCTAIARETAQNVNSLPVASPEILLASPAIIEFSAFSPSNKESVYTPGITFNITFDQPTDFGISKNPYSNGTIMRRSVIDSLFTFSQALGADYTGKWISPSNILITVQDVRGNGRPRIGTTTVSMLPSARIQIASVASSLFGGPGLGTSPVLGGNFGTAPVGFYWGVTNGVEGMEQVQPTQFNLSSIGETLLGADTGVSHAFFWSTDQRTYGLGANKDNQLGWTNQATLQNMFSLYTTNGYVTKLVPIDTLEGVDVLSISSGKSHSLLLTSRGILYTCGSNTYGQVGLNLHGSSFTGSTPWVELRLNASSGIVYDPSYTTAIGGSGNFSSTNLLWNVIEAGYDFSLVARTPLSGGSSSVYAWGRHFGSRYNPVASTAYPSTNFLTPQKVNFTATSSASSSSSNIRITAMAAGVEHVLFLTDTGTVWVWGRNIEGQIGLGLPVLQVDQPTQLKLSISIVSISAGAYHSILISNSSTVLCFGKNSDGQCGIQPESRRIFLPTEIPTSLFNNTYAQSISTGATYTHYTNYGGDVYAFGTNDYYTLGLSDSYVSQPTYVTGLKSASIAKIYSTRDLSVALTPNKESPCLRGCNNHGSCFSNACQCTPEWTGEECEIPICTAVNGKQCSGNGTCIIKDDAPYCSCFDRFTGSTCLDPNCASLGSCSLGGTSHGSCKFGSALVPFCACDLGFKSPKCDSCEEGFKDAPSTTGTCNTLDCSAWSDCSGKGSCQIRGSKGQCVCNDGYVGKDCTTPFCSGTPVCSGHGSCISPASNNSAIQPACACDDRWTGTLCDTYTCAGTPVCSGQGTCQVLSGVPTCKCNSGFLSLDCSIASCAGELNDCSGHGSCVTRDGAPACDCDSSYTGSDCGNQSEFQNTVIIALIVVGIILLVVLMCACAFFLYRRSVTRYSGGGSQPRRNTGFFDPITQKSNKIFTTPF